MIDPRTPIENVPLAFFDVETTGLNPALGHRVVEVGIVYSVGDAILTEYQQLVNPQRPSDPGALRVHGITDEMVRGAPLFASIADQVLALLDGAVFVGHNVLFDMGFLQAELERARQPRPRITALDTLTLARLCWHAPSYSLDNLCRGLGIRKAGHRALGDAQATRQLFLQIREALAGSEVLTLGDYFAVQGRQLDWRHVRRVAQPVEPPPVIREAMESGALLWVRYEDARGSYTERTLRPMEVTGRPGQTYLRAYCYMRQSERTFAIERIREMRVVDKDSDSDES
jgi:DNA polymerase III subunit epsilon